MTTVYDRGDVVKGPDLFADHAAATTTQRDFAVRISEKDFKTGGLPRETFVNPWTVVTIRHADIQYREGELIQGTTEEIASETAGYLGVRN